MNLANFHSGSTTMTAA